MKGLGQIVAMGGGGFLMEPEKPLLDDFVLSLVSKENVKICFVPTASAESAQALVKFYRAFSGKAIASDLTLFDLPSLPRRPSKTSDIAHFISEQDIIYVGGGNTANMLAMWRVHGLDRVFRESWSNGKVFCGVSAGMICWFCDGITDSFGGLEKLGDGLGFIDASACPHYDSEPNRPEVYRTAIANNMLPGYAADDGVALHFIGNEFVEAISSRKNANAYRVEFSNGFVSENKLVTRYLG